MHVGDILLIVYRLSKVSMSFLFSPLDRYVHTYILSIPRACGFNAEMMKTDRQVIADNTSKALRAKASGKPLHYVHISADAANQSGHSLRGLHPPTHDGESKFVCLTAMLGIDQLDEENLSMTKLLCPQ